VIKKKGQEILIFNQFWSIHYKIKVAQSQILPLENC